MNCFLAKYKGGLWLADLWTAFRLNKMETRLNAGNIRLNTQAVFLQIEASYIDK